MERLPPLTGPAKRYEEFISNPDGFIEFAPEIVFCDDFKKVFRRHAKMMSEFWEGRGLQPSQSAASVYQKYTDAYLEYIYDDVRVNYPGNTMTWEALGSFLDNWDRDQYMQMANQSTTENLPDGSSPSA